MHKQTNTKTSSASKVSRFALMRNKISESVAKANLKDRFATFGKWIATGVGFILRVGNTVVTFTLAAPLIAYGLAVAGICKIFDAIMGGFNKSAEV